MRMIAIAVVALAAIGGAAYYGLSSNNEAPQPSVKELTVVKDSVKAKPVDTVKPQPADTVKPEKKEEVKRHIRFTAPVIKKDVDDTDKSKKKYCCPLKLQSSCTRVCMCTQASKNKNLG